jgi:hypothetical protein
MSEWNLKFPHIKYISEIQTKPEEGTLYYLGGEPEENHSRLTLGKQYIVRTVSYSEVPEVERVSVWICSDDENKGKLCRINLDNFGTFADLRNKKIEQIIK